MLFKFKQVNLSLEKELEELHWILKKNIQQIKR